MKLWGNALDAYTDLTTKSPQRTIDGGVRKRLPDLKIHLYTKKRRTLVAKYNGPDAPPTGPVIINYLDPEGQPANQTRMHLDYETTGRVEVIHGGLMTKLNIQLDPKKRSND